MTVYMSHTHPQHPDFQPKRTPGAHRQTTRWSSVGRWIRAPRPRRANH